MKQRFRLIPASYLFLIKDARVLLLRRANTGYEDGNWSVPAGHLEGDEAATYTMVREAKEEIGLHINAKDLTLVHVMHRRGIDEYGKENERVAFFFALEKWEGEPENMEPNKCDSLDWFALTNLPKNTIPYIRFALEAYQSHNTFSEEGW
jgi:8-oxo-dGTP diphosphatase